LLKLLLIFKLFIEFHVLVLNNSIIFSIFLTVLYDIYFKKKYNNNKRFIVLLNQKKKKKKKKKKKIMDICIY